MLYIYIHTFICFSFKQTQIKLSTKISAPCLKSPSVLRMVNVVVGYATVTTWFEIAPHGHQKIPEGDSRRVLNIRCVSVFRQRFLLIQK